MDYLDYLDEIYEELVDEFGHEIESDCIHQCDLIHTPAIGVSLENVGGIGQNSDYQKVSQKG